MKTKQTCLCLKCGGGFELAIEEGTDLGMELCPLCGGQNVVRHNPQEFFNLLFGRIGGG